LILHDIGAQLVDETDAPPLVAGGVDQHALPGGVDGAQRELELDAALTAQRAERIAGQALGVDPCQDVLRTGHLAPDEREVDEARR
jgi:hypothetical protein